MSDNELLQTLIQKVDNLEKTFIALNANLIQQNIELSKKVNGKLPDPTPVNDETNGNGSNGSNGSTTGTKEIYYYKNNGKIIIHGPGTYDNKDKFREYGGWNSVNKTWDLVIEENKLIEILPNIIMKEK